MPDHEAAAKELFPLIRSKHSSTKSRQLLADALREAERRGAESMRERAADVAEYGAAHAKSPWAIPLDVMQVTLRGCAIAIRALPLEDD